MLGDRWGVTEAETRQVFGCDTFVVAPTLRAWRGVTVAAPPDEVWPWVAQIRLAPYSYDWIDNLGRRSPPRLRGLDEPTVGEPFTATAGRPMGRIVAVEPGVSLTGEILGAYLTYRVQPVLTGSSRLLLKVVMETRRPLADLVCLGDLVMARRQLLRLREHVEGTAG